MPDLAPGAVLANTAAGLNQQLIDHLRGMAREVVAAKPVLEGHFAAHLRRLGYSIEQCKSLGAITFGAAASILESGADLRVFLEQVDYSGRRLAKLDLTPARVVGALRQYDRLLDERIGRRRGRLDAGSSWARDQFHFLVVLALNNAYYQVREAESRAFHELFRAEVETRSLSEMLARFLSTLVSYTQAAAGCFYMAGVQGEGWMRFAPQPHQAGPHHPHPQGRIAADLAKPRCFAITGRTAAWILEPAWRNSFRYCWSVPLVSSGTLRGVFQFGFPRAYRWLPREIALLSDAAERCWRAAEKARLLENLADREEEIRRLAARMVEVEESERRRISRELHDEAGQSLLCVRLQLEMLEQALPATSAHLTGKLAEARRMTEHSITEIRRLIADLSPSVLEHMGLPAALRQLAARLRKFLAAEVKLTLPSRADIPRKLEIIVYRLVQEIFNNIVKYSHAARVNLSLASADGCLRLVIEDDGVGFDVREASSRRGCYGLSGLRERVAIMGGIISIRSIPREEGARATPARFRAKSKSGCYGVERPGSSIVIELPLRTAATSTGSTRLAQPMHSNSPQAWEYTDGQDTHPAG